MQKKESPDFRFPEVGISDVLLLQIRLDKKLHSKGCQFSSYLDPWVYLDSQKWHLI